MTLFLQAEIRLAGGGEDSQSSSPGTELRGCHWGCSCKIPHAVWKYSADQTLQHTEKVFSPLQDSKREECSQQCKETLSSLRVCDEQFYSGNTFLNLSVGFLFQKKCDLESVTKSL